MTKKLRFKGRQAKSLDKPIVAREPLRIDEIDEKDSPYFTYHWGTDAGSPYSLGWGSSRDIRGGDRHSQSFTRSAYFDRSRGSLICGPTYGEFSYNREPVFGEPIQVGSPLNLDQAYRIAEKLEESRGLEYTKAKEALTAWADTLPGAFQPNQIFRTAEYGPKLLAAWKDYEKKTNEPLRRHRQVYNKFWDRLVTSFEMSKAPYDHVFQMIGDNLWIMSITHPLEILIARKFRTSGKPNLETLLSRFAKWVKSSPERAEKYKGRGFNIGSAASVWTQSWPWRR